MKHGSALQAIVLATGVMAGGLGPSAVAQPSGGGGNDALNLLYNQFSDMQSELAELRAMVEQQAMEIRRLQRDTRDRYTDLDSRLSSLYQELESGELASSSSSASATASGGSETLPQERGVEPVNAAEAPQEPASQSSSSELSEALPDPDAMTEQQLYQWALDSLLQEEEYQLSTEAFDLYLDAYPDGRFVTNAWYWKGQALVNLSMLEEARDAFEVIVNDYPDGRKIADAMYSLGTVYGQLGNVSRARELLQEVMNRFPNTSAANLADIYLRSLN